jgi:putative copper export protein
MTIHHVLLIVHILAATIWVGGHLLLAIAFLPEALRKKSPEIIAQFETKFEKIGLPALLLLVISGVWLTVIYKVSLIDIIEFKEPIARVVACKLFLLLCTLALAIQARLFIIPKLTAATLTKLAIHIVLVTIIGVLMLIVGSFVRFGGL